MKSAAGQTRFKSCPPKNLPSVEKGRDERMSPGQEGARQKESVSLAAHTSLPSWGGEGGEPERRKETDLIDTSMGPFHMLPVLVFTTAG